MNPFFSENNITIYNGRSEDILPLLNDPCDLVLTDPPFGINYQNNYTSGLKERIVGDTSFFSYSEWASQLFRLLKQDRALFSFTGWSEYPHHFDEIKKCGFSMKEPLIVQKRASGTSDLYGSFQSNSDWIIFAHKGRFKFRETMLLKNKRAGCIPNKGRSPVPEYKTRFPSCWFGPEFPWSTENPAVVGAYKHPTIKTVELMKWLISLSTNEGDLIIDPFLGSGSTAIAASELKRRFIGIEVEKQYCEISIERIRDARN